MGLIRPGASGAGALAALVGALGVVALASVSAPAAPDRVQVSPLRGVRSWAVYYGDDLAAASRLARFDLVVLDPGRHPPLDAVKRHGALVLMYVSLGELNVAHPAHAALGGAPWVLDANPNWPDARRLDVRDPGWQRWLLETVVPAALTGPVNGLFLDTADTALNMEMVEPGRFAGMATALEQALSRLRERHPRALLVLNGGLPWAERVAPLLDGIALESIATDYDFGTKAYRTRDEASAIARAAGLRRLADRVPALLTIEYADPLDAAGAARAAAASRAQGFVPYVTTIGLDRAPAEVRPATR